MDWSTIVDMWQVVGGIGTLISILVAVISIILSVHFYKKSKRTARLALAFSPPTWLVNVDRDAAGRDIDKEADRILISYDGNRVRNAFIVQGRVINRGNTPLKEQDVHRPLTFSFAEGAQLLSAAISDTNPIGLDADIEIVNASSARLSFDLLNPGDTVLVTFVSTGKRKTPTPSARIEGVSRIEREPWGDQRSRGAYGIFMILVDTMVALAIAAYMLVDLLTILPPSLPIWFRAGLPVLILTVLGAFRFRHILRRTRREYFES